MALVVSGALAISAARAEADRRTESRASAGFIELTGGYDVQIGDIEYLPDGSPDDFKYPYVDGYFLGGTLGLNLKRGIALVGKYEYAQAWTPTGDIAGVLDEVQGEIDYHTATVGLRLSKQAGAGRVMVQFSAGIIFPFETKLEYTYGPALAMLPEGAITGRGSRTENFSLGYGGHGMVGYEFPFTERIYLGLGIELSSFQSENKGETTVFENFVTDFEAERPIAIDATIEHGDGQARPETRAVQSARGHLSLGVRF